MALEDQLKLLIELENRSIKDFKEIYGDIVIKYIKEIKIKKMNLNNNSLSLSPFGSAFVDALEKIFMVSYLAGRTVTHNRIVEQSEFADLDKIDFSKIRFGEAIRILNDKEVLVKPAFSQLSGQIKVYSFTVARIERIELLTALRESLTLAIADGLPLERWKDLLPEIFNKFGVTPLTPHHLENVLRTNINTVFNAAAFEGYIFNENVEGIEHFGVDDRRRRSDHAALDGVYRMTDSNISNLIPPHDYQCRCGTAPVVFGQKKSAAGNKIKFEKVKHPDTLPPEFKKDNATLGGAIKRLKEVEKDKQKELSKK